MVVEIEEQIVRLSSIANVFGNWKSTVGFICTFINCEIGVSRNWDFIVQLIEVMYHLT